MISPTVAMNPDAAIIVVGIHGLISWVYSKKLSQFPQTDISMLKIPNLSATDDKNPNEIGNSWVLKEGFSLQSQIGKTSFRYKFNLVKFSNFGQKKINHSIRNGTRTKTPLLSTHCLQQLQPCFLQRQRGLKADMGYTKKATAWTKKGETGHL